MKKFLTILLMVMSNWIIGQDIQSLTKEIQDLRLRVETLERIIAIQFDSLPKYKNTTATPSASETKRCIAITNAGTQCSRNAEPGSDYCWQHKKTYEPTSSTSVTKSTTSTSSSTTSTGKTIYTGPRGGKYYINSSGKKVYVKKK